MKGLFKPLASRLMEHHDRRALGAEDFVIVSNNCWGFECYKTLGRGYNTPFVGLFLYPSDYLKLLANFGRLAQERPKFRHVSRHFPQVVDYPIGVILGDVEIHFLHYSSPGQAREVWTRRLERMSRSLSQGSPLLFKMCDRDGCTDEELAAFHQLPLVRSGHRVSFGVRALPEPQHLQVPSALREPRGQAADGLILYRRRYGLFDFETWVKSGRVRSPRVLRLLDALQ